MDEDRKITQVPAVYLNKPPPRILRVAAYCRVSTLSEEQTTSIEAQIDYYHQLILNHAGWQLVDIYVDRNTGRNTRKQREFQRLLDDCRNSKIDLVITKSISRLCRNTVQLLQVTQELKTLYIDIYFEVENLHLHDPRAMLMITILGSVAQEESRNKSENIKWGIQHSFLDPNSKYLNRPCYGYRPGPKNTLQIEPSEAAVITLIFQLYADGKSLRQIGKQLHKLGVKPPRGGGRWGPETIRYILSNEKYKGDVHLQKTYVEDYYSGKQKKNNGELAQYFAKDSHPAIIEE
jgi:DNA invertase Pin-like site-specific DNA recombinase